MADPSTRLRQSGQRLPSGTVTFLFTDIEGSINLVQQGIHQRLNDAEFENAYNTGRFVMEEWARVTFLV